MDQAAMLFLVQHRYRVIGIDRRGHDFEIESSGSYVTPDEKAPLLALPCTNCCWQWRQLTSAGKVLIGREE
jgi:hypothetical protein